MLAASFGRCLGCVVAASLILLSNCTSSRADLQIIGGSDSQQRSLQKTYEKNLASYVPRDTVIHVDLVGAEAMLDIVRSQPGNQGRSMQDEKSVDSSATSDDDIDGIYIDEDPQTIALLKDGPSGNLQMTFAHEFGHLVWVHILTDKQRDQFCRIYGGEDKADLITEYAADSPEEGFAEAFSFYALKRSKLADKDPEEYRYLAQILPQGATLQP